MNLLDALKDLVNENSNSDKASCIIAKWMADEECNLEKLAKVDNEYLSSKYQQDISLLKNRARSFKRLINEK